MCTVLKKRYEFNSLISIGTGAYGACYKAKDKFEGEQVCLKTITNIKSAPVDKIEQEAAMLEQLQHPCIARGIEHFWETVQGVNCLCIIMDFYPNGDLRQYTND